MTMKANQDELFQKAQYAHQSGNSAEAERQYRALLAAAPDHAQGLRLFALLLLAQGKAAEAEPHIARACALAPDEAYMHQNHTLVLSELGRFDEAAAAASRAIKIDPAYALAYFNRANALAQSARAAEALRDYERAQTRGLKDPLLFFALGITHTTLGHTNDALQSYAQSIALKPDFVEAIANRGLLLQQMHRHDESLAAFERAISLNPNGAELHNMRGTALYELRRLNEAAEAYRVALALQPDYAKVYHNAAILLMYMRDYDRARAACEHAFALDPSLPHLEGNRLHMHQQLCDWYDYDARVRALLAHIDEGRPAAMPFNMLLLPATLEQQYKVAARHANEKCPPQNPLHGKKRKANARLRIAYVGKDFYNHATAVLFTEIVERHDRDAVEIFAFSHGPDDKSPERARLIAGFEHFSDCRDLSDKQIAEHIAAANIDIAIDLDGYTKDSRPGILSHRPAHIQASFLGYPGTMAASHIDYILSDAIVTPPEDAIYYSEKFALLPGAYQPNSKRPDPAPATRAQSGLPDSGFVFGCFNNNFKITPDVFSVWMKILARVPASVFWLFGPIATARDNLIREAEARGIDPLRLVFAPMQDMAPHIARLKNMDLFLDTFIYGAHTTASDALWADVPLITLRGNSFQSRVAASLLTTIGLPELITHSPEEYENLAVALANDPARLAALKQKIHASRDTLFDAARFARNLENAYRQMWERHEAGENPESFSVQP